LEATLHGLRWCVEHGVHEVLVHMTIPGSRSGLPARGEPSNRTRKPMSKRSAAFLSRSVFGKSSRIVAFPRTNSLIVWRRRVHSRVPGIAFESMRRGWLNRDPPTLALASSGSRPSST
jgi:hypothetical protein